MENKKRSFSELVSANSESDSTAPPIESQANKKLKNDSSIASPSSNEEAQEVKTLPPRELTTEEMDQISPNVFEQTTVAEDNNSDEDSLQLISDEEESYDANYERLLEADAITKGSLLNNVKEYNEKTLGSKENKEILVPLLSGALIQICFDKTKFETSNVVISQSNISSSCEDYLRILKLFFDLKVVNELCLQSFSTFPILAALSEYTKQDDFYMNINGGGKYKIVELQKIAQKLNLNSMRFHSDLDFCLDKTKIVNVHQFSFPKTFYPYFGVYEVKKTSKTASIETHYDFIKIIGALRAIAKSYSMTLNMSPTDLEQICLWGILQSSTKIWFLQCNIEPNKINSSENTFSLLYNFVCSESFDLNTDNEQISKLYCRVFDSGKQLQKLLENFKPDFKSSYPNTIISRQLFSQKFTKLPFKEDTAEFLQIKSNTLRCMSADKNNEFTKKFISNMFTLYQWSSNGLTKITNSYNMFFYIGMNQSNTFFYLLIGNTLYEISLLHNGIRNPNATLHYVICQEEFDELDEPATNQEVEYIVFQFINSNSGELQMIKTTEGVPIEGSSSQQNMTNHTGSTQENNQQLQSQQQQQQQQSTTNSNTNYYLLPLNSLEMAFNKATLPFKYDVHCKHETNNGIYCTVTTRNTYGCKFLKVTRAFMHLECFEAMQKLLNKELNHKHLMRVYKHDILLGPDKSRQIIVATETEILKHYTDVIPEQFKNKIEFVKWIVKDVFFGALDALHYLHQNQIIHGDISINNIMFRMDYPTKETYAVLIDLNDSIPFSTLNRPIISFGTEGYVPNSMEKPSIFTDCYGLVVTICVLIYYALFEETIHLAKEYHNLYPIFEISNWKVTFKEQEKIVQQFITNLHNLFETIVIQMKFHDSFHSVQDLKTYFQTKLQLVSSEDKENIPVQCNNAPTLVKLKTL